MSRPVPWPEKPVTLENFRNPPREYGILPFWFLNGELKPEEMLFQLREYQAKGMPGIILHGRYGLEMSYIGPDYLERIRLAVEEAEKLGLKTWIYDEMNWPSGTADKQVLQARPDLSQRYIECVNFTTRGPWFTYLTGADSRYNDFERSTPVAAFAVGLDGRGPTQQVIDLTPNLSFRDVIPWEAPAGNWRLIYIVEKEADYYIDALNPEATKEFLRLGYDPYARSVKEKLSTQILGFYTDEPAMHYYLTGGENPILPWTKDMFHRFQERNGYNLRPHLPDLFFDISPQSARVRYDFFSSLTEFYSHAFYQQIHQWCQKHDVLFTGHLLYEEWMRKLVRVEGNLFKHYEHMDVIGVDHLYPIVGSRDRPDEHVAMKVGSSAAHLLGSPRLLCESFGGIFMDATMQRMKWIADWEYVLGVNLLNPHGFHYTLEGPRKRDWPPSQFYQYPWWRYYGEFSTYISRLSHMLSGGRHVAKVAVLWPINAMFATYLPQSPHPLALRIENDFNALTDTLLRLHYDFDYLDEDILTLAELKGSQIRVRDEAYELVILPPMAHLKLSTLEMLEHFVAGGGKILGMVFLPDQAFVPDDNGVTGLVDISSRVEALFDVDPLESQQNYQRRLGVEQVDKEHVKDGKASFLRTYALARKLPLRLQRELGVPGLPESPFFTIESQTDYSRYFFTPKEGEKLGITAEVEAEGQLVSQALQDALGGLITPDIVIDNPNIFYLHRVKDEQDIYFLVNSTYSAQTAAVSIPGNFQPMLWDPSLGTQKPIAPVIFDGNNIQFSLTLPAVGSAFVLATPGLNGHIVDTNLAIDQINTNAVRGYGRTNAGYTSIQKNGTLVRHDRQAAQLPEPLVLDGSWEFQAENPNALVIGKWLAVQESPGKDLSTYTAPQAVTLGWLPMVPGTWSYQLPSEPDLPYPIPVWYRINFQANYLPPKLDLIVDGFAGSEWKLYVNGEPAEAKPVRSSIDSQMKAVDITSLIHPGENVIALRLVLTGPTDGLLDLLKLMGEFSLQGSSKEGYQIAPPQGISYLQSWTFEGYPFYSGPVIYRRRFTLPAGFNKEDDLRIFLEPQMFDDALEVIVNGEQAGIRLWAPYDMEITGHLIPGENQIELRVANTLINLLEAVERPSGLCGAPRLVPYRQYQFIGAFSDDA